MTASATAGTGEGRADPGLREQLTGFRLVGGVTTAAYLLLYVLLRPSLGEQVANLVALALTVDANTVANRRLSFAVRADGGRGREHAQAWVAFAVWLLLSSGVLAALEAHGITSGAVHLAVLVAAEAVAGVVHFVLLRSWVFAPHRRTPATVAG
ncbi:MAG: GtrA family protein [Actinomycetota bacterium]|nr:GtrA family protein [Actinomycetota bacterium]